MGSMPTILVTGSRHAKDADRLCWALDEILDQYSYDAVTVMVGCCPTGTDKFVKDWWLRRFGEPDGYVITSPEPLRELYTANPGPQFAADGQQEDWDDGFRDTLHIFHADWYPEPGKLDRSAGPKRNSRLVKAWNSEGGTHAVAQWAADEGGTFDTMKKIIKANRCIDAVVPA
jgi:hypothetical protein